MLPALGTLATQQASPTRNTMNQIKQFLDYAATHPDAVLIYHAIDMVQAGHSNTKQSRRTLLYVQQRADTT